jgi:gliding motility-associated-like protein
VGADAPCTVPTIFTPNGDGINDQLIITCLLDDTGYPDSQITIYNNWGDEVYRSPIPYQNDWDGTFKGKNLPVGTYYYILNFGSGGTPVAGFIVIQR